MHSEKVFNKSPATIRRNISIINSYIFREKTFLVSGNLVISRIDYSSYLDLIKRIPLEEYHSSQEERVSLMLVSSFFKDPLNKTSLYSYIGIGSSTLKKDTRECKSILLHRDLDMVTVSKRGGSVLGDETNFRILATRYLYRVLEVDKDNKLVIRPSNTPLERLIAETALDNLVEGKRASLILDEIFSRYNIEISYSSKKFFLIYINIALYRIGMGKNLQKGKDKEYPSIEMDILGDSMEDNTLVKLLLSLDMNSRLFTPYDKNLLVITRNIISHIEGRIITKFRNYDKVLEEVYTFLYKSILRYRLGYSIFDDKVEEIEDKFKELFDNTRDSVMELSKLYNIIFSYEQIATLTLILKKHITISKVAGRNRVKTIIVSNSAVEKIDFFIERLKLHVEVDIVAVIDINELHLLKSLEFSKVITFSNRISMLLNSIGEKNIKLPFHLTDTDVEKLLSVGFSRAKRKLLAGEIAEKIVGMNEVEIKDLLTSEYSDYFVE